MTLAPGDRTITIQTTTGPLTIPYVAPAAGDRAIFFPDGNGGYIAHKYTAPAAGEKYVSIPMPNGVPVALGLSGSSTGWTLQTDDAEWGPRAAHCMVSLSYGPLIIMAGWIQQSPIINNNDVWRSTDIGKTWTLRTATPGWSTRRYAVSVVTSDDHIIIMGGVNDAGGVYTNDVWISLDAGLNWIEQNPAAPWDADGGTLSSAVILSDDSIIAIDGPRKKVWKSTNKGVNWVLQTGSASWTARSEESCAVLPDDTIILTGGFSTGGSYLNDVWISVDKGVTWTQQTAAADWSARYGHVCVIKPNGNIYLISGAMGSGYSTELWESTDRGVHWFLQTALPWAGREAFAAVVNSSNNIIVSGGITAWATFPQEVWLGNIP